MYDRSGDKVDGHGNAEGGEEKKYVDFDDPKNDKGGDFREMVNYDDLFD